MHAASGMDNIELPRAVWDDVSRRRPWTLRIGRGTDGGSVPAI